MRKIFFLFIGLSIFTSSVAAEVTAEEIGACTYDYLQAFDEADQQLLLQLEQLTSQNSQNTSNLASALPSIIRTHRCHLYWICSAAENAEKEDDAILNVFGCQLTTIGEVQAKFSRTLETCDYSKTDLSLNEIQKIRNNCFAYADFKIEQLKIVVPALLRKDANRKRMAYLSYKLYDLTTRLKEFYDQDVLDFRNQFNKIMENIKCIVDQCD